MLPLAAMFAAVFAAGCAGPDQKLGRGLSNTCEVVRWGELRQNVEENAILKRPGHGYYGFVHGLQRSLVRTGVGVYEVATFPIPNGTDPTSYDPVLTKYYSADPAYPLSYKPGTLSDALFDTESGGEFWEVRFWVCLDRRLWNLVEKRQGALDVQLREAEAPSGIELGEAESLLARLTDPAPGPEALAERNSAMAILTETERLAVFLKYVEGLPEESDDPERVTAAKILGVTGRSVRNYLRRAEEKLIQWQQT